MSFFDSKEEVINIELTQYGKEIFSKGIFQPAYYEFFDDDIIYDSSWGGISEEQNSIETRILEETVYMKPIYNFSDRIKASERYDFLKTQSTNLLNKKQTLPISSTDSINNFKPAWDIKIINGSAKSYNYSSNLVEINMNDLEVTVGGDSIDNLSINLEDIILEIDEINCLSKKDNFEIELFEIDPSIKDEYGRNFLNKISFGNESIYIKDGILLDKPIYSNLEPQNDLSKVEYYFKISVDKKIDTLTLKNLKEKQKKIYNSAIAEE